LQHINQLKSMEQQKFGLLKGIECRFVKTDPELIEAIATKLGLSIAQVKGLMRYNMFTVPQFVKLTGLTRSMIEDRTQPSVVDGAYNTNLDYTYPFSSIDKDGPKFIVRNKKAEKYLKA